MSQRRRRCTRGYETRTGISRCRELRAVGGLQQRRLQGVDRPRDDLVALGDLGALDQGSGVEGDGQLGAVELGVELLVGLAHVLGHGEQLEASGFMTRRTGVDSRP